jgi:putative ABC transport system ATP-binding protein
MSTNKMAVAVSELSKVYEIRGADLKVLTSVDLNVPEGDLTVIGGPSGSGKTTLLNIIAGIDRPTSGKISVFGEDFNSKNEDYLSNFRCGKIGFVFQSYNLVSTLTVAENVAFPMEWLQIQGEQIRNRVDQLVESMGLQERSMHFPFQLSGGEQQRVAFARALANDPPLLLIDEPTGNLDEQISAKIVEIIGSLNKVGKTIIVTTHDGRIFEKANHSLWLEEGKLVSQHE